MLAGAAVDQGKGSAQPTKPHHTPVDPLSFTSQPPIPSPIPSPPHPSPLPHSPLQSPLYSPPHSPLQSPLYSPPHLPHQSPPFSPPHFSPPRSYEAPLPEGNTSGSAKDSMQLKELMVLVPTLVTKINSLEKEGGSRRRYQSTILEAAKTLSKLASIGVSKEKSTDKGKRYRRRARFMAKKIDTGLDAEEEINTGREETNTGIEEVSTGSTKVDSGTVSKRGQKEGKAPMIEEDIQEEEPVKRTRKRKKQKARKVVNVDKVSQKDSETNKEESVEAMNPTPLTTKSDSVVNWKIFQQEDNGLNKVRRKNDMQQSVCVVELQTFTSNVIGGTKLRWRHRRERKETLCRVQGNVEQRVRSAEIETYTYNKDKGVLKENSVEKRVGETQGNNNNENRNNWKVCLGANEKQKQLEADWEQDAEVKRNKGNDVGITTNVVAGCKTARELWESLKKRHVGEERVQQARLQSLMIGFNTLQMKDDDTVDAFTAKLNSYATKAKELGENLDESL
ncbi:hypothetical protein Tco_1538332 [Tanacetum coccineum]